MTKSRSWALCLLPSVVIAAPATAQPVDPQALIDHQREELRNGARLGCPPGAASDEIVICATRRNQPQSPRSPLPYAPDPRRRIPGEALVDSGGCMRLCHEPVGFSVIEAIGLLGRAVSNLQERGD